jgi:hypothetical protein
MMGFSDNLSGAGLTVALPLGTLAAVVLWGFFDRRPGRSFGGISKGAAPEAVGRPEIDTVDAGAERGAGGVENPLR